MLGRNRAALRCHVIPGWRTLVGTSTPSHRLKQSPQARWPSSKAGPTAISQLKASPAAMGCWRGIALVGAGYCLPAVPAVPAVPDQMLGRISS